MKIAISGKGGVGKTTFCSLLVRTLDSIGEKILAIDADPDANFATALGFSNVVNISSIAEMKELIFERTGAKPGTMGGFFKINPRVDDIPDKFSIKKGNIKLIKLGKIKQGGTGCLCPESTFLKALVTHIVIGRGEWVVMDMEAGIEHLGRATAQAVDKLVVVVEPGFRSIETARNINRLASEIKINEILIVGNKVRNDKDKKFLESSLKEFNFLGHIDYNSLFIEADLEEKSPYDLSPVIRKKIVSIISNMRSNNF